MCPVDSVSGLACCFIHCKRLVLAPQAWSGNESTASSYLIPSLPPPCVRLIQAHNLPCYLEDDLSSQLERYVRDVSLQVCDEEAEERMYGGSVFEKVGCVGRGQ